MGIWLMVFMITAEAGMRKKKPIEKIIILNLFRCGNKSIWRSLDKLRRMNLVFYIMLLLQSLKNIKIRLMRWMRQKKTGKL